MMANNRKTPRDGDSPGLNAINFFRNFINERGRDMDEHRVGSSLERARFCHACRGYADLAGFGPAAIAPAAAKFIFDQHGTG